MISFINRFFKTRPPFQKTFIFASKILHRSVRIEVFFPPNFKASKTYPLLLVNDGQDFSQMKFSNILENLYQKQQIVPLLVVGIHAANRIQEYGTALVSDYKNRGEKSANYQAFVLEELIPFLQNKERLKGFTEMAAAGFSLGGLSAFDLVWNHPTRFGKVGVFSGALWWRSKAFDPENPDADRVVHTYVEASNSPPHLQFWFQTGTEDEKEDRNNNGIIDAIDDTLDLIHLLENKGYERGRQVRYLEIEGGIHHPSTWAEAMPDFLRWGFGKKRYV